MSKLSEWIHALQLKKKANDDLNRYKGQAKTAIDSAVNRLLSRVDTNDDGRVLDSEVMAVVFDELGKARVPDLYLIPLRIAITVGIIRIDGTGERAKAALVRMADNIKRRIDGARF